MKKLSLFIFFILISANTRLVSQNKKYQDNFTQITSTEEGDLNKDKIADKIIVATDNTAEIRSFRLQIFLSQPKSKQLKLAVSSTKILEKQYDAEKYGMKKNFRIPDIFVENGKLTLLTDINELKSRYIFRFNNGNFELTNISRISSDGRETTTETEIDLLRGTKVVYDQDFGPNKKYKVREKFKPKPLPKIQDLTASDLAKY